MHIVSLKGNFSLKLTKLVSTNLQQILKSMFTKNTNSHSLLIYKQINSTFIQISLLSFSVELKNFW